MNTPEQDRLAEIKQRAEKATPGPWVRPPSAGTEADGLGEQWIHNSEVGAKEYAVAVTFFANPRLEEDAEFIVHSRADIDWLVSQVETLRCYASAAADQLRRQNERWENRTPTQDAYDGACAALHKHSDRAYATAEALGLDRYASRDEMVAEVERLRAALPAKDGAE